MTTPALPPPPQEEGESPPRARWLQLLWNNLARVQLTAAGPFVTTGAGVPSADLPNGSLYLRTDGAGPNLYVRENGAWVAK